MRKVYLDHAATTPMYPEVVQEMLHVMQNDFGNPSSSHGFGRQAKSIIELARKSIAGSLKATTSEIVFTSGGTEANNWVLRNAVHTLRVERIISAKIEHHAVLQVLEALQNEKNVSIDYVNLLPNGEVDLGHLDLLLSDEKKTLVSLMHVNNEIGTILDMQAVGTLCRKHNAYFHSDTVQSVGKFSFDLSALPIDFMVASAHKFNGPKGVGFLFVRRGIAMSPLLYGGEQEKGIRSGTESVHNIAGMAKALQISLDKMDNNIHYVSELRKYLIEKLKQSFPAFAINGNPDGFYNIVNVRLPFSPEKTAIILFHLDIKGIAVSRGSACQSGSPKPSHVLAEILSGSEAQAPSIRVSLGSENTREDIDQLIQALQDL